MKRKQENILQSKVNRRTLDRFGRQKVHALRGEDQFNRLYFA